MLVLRFFRCSLVVSLLIGISGVCHAQQQPFAIPGQPIGNNGNNQGQNGLQGGGNDADFDSLIDLIISTVAPETWAEAGGGEAEIRPFVSGVYVDAEGTLQRLVPRPDSQLVALRREARLGQQPPLAAAGDARRPTQLRCVSLVRLERELARRLTAGEPLDEAMLALAGLRRIEYVFLFPATKDQPGDLAIAGPAGDWQATEGRLLARNGNAQEGAVVRLDDLIEILRHTANGSPNFGCTINPRQKELAEAQSYINAAAAKPLPPGAKQRKKWLEAIRSRVGKQDVEFFDIDPSSRVAQVIIDADHHMKLIGMGLEKGVVGVESYLDSIDPRSGNIPAFGVMRWWFAMNYAAVRGTESKDGFQIVGPGAKVLSENQLLTEQGQRVPTGKSDELTAQFAASFTTHFATLCKKYPVYSELRNVFDLALVTTLMHDQQLFQRAGWTPSLFTDSGSLPLPRYRTPKTVETVANHRLINRSQIVAGVSGGVSVAPRRVLQTKSQPAGNAYGPLTRHDGQPPADLAATAWWWDVQ